jgi:hypothetical protein
MFQKRIFPALILVAATLALPTVAAAACIPDGGGLGLFFMDLAVPTAGGPVPFQANQSFFGGVPQIQNIIGFTPSTLCAGTYETVLKVTIPNGCTEANIWVEYEGTPTLWTINVGDSPTNNGYGGNSGGPESAAELQILGETLSVYSKGLSPGIVDLLAQEDMGLTDGALEIVVRNQYVSWGQPFSSLDTTNSGLLFALPDPGAPTALQSTFYVGVNRVIYGPGARTGCGVRRVLVSFR